MSTTVKMILGVLLGLLMGSCSVKQLAIEHGAESFNCPQDQIKSKWIDARTYRISGCGSPAVVVCSSLTKKCKNDSMGPF